MPLQGSGAISISQIRTELINVNASYSLRTLSSAAGKSSPDAMSEFYGFALSPPTIYSELQVFNADHTINAYYSQWTMTLKVDASSILPITQRGIVYSYTSATPTIANSTVLVISNTNGFQTISPINFFYGRGAYVRAFATNSKGTTYIGLSGGSYINPSFNYYYTDYWPSTNYANVTVKSLEYGVDGFEYGSNIQIARATVTIVNPNTGFEGFSAEITIYPLAQPSVTYPCSFDGFNMSFTIVRGVHVPSQFCWEFKYVFGIGAYRGASSQANPVYSAFIHELDCP